MFHVHFRINRINEKQRIHSKYNVTIKSKDNKPAKKKNHKHYLKDFNGNYLLLNGLEKSILYLS